VGDISVTASGNVAVNTGTRSSSGKSTGTGSSAFLTATKSGARMKVDSCLSLSAQVVSLQLSYVSEVFFWGEGGK
jgi:hypothetical protein